MASNIPRQGAFFYQGNWSPEIDAVMLQTIISTKRDAKWEGTVIPIPFLVEASRTIAAEIGISFTWSELYERFQLLEQRFRAFKEVVDTYGVFWNVNDNTISAAEPVWNALLQKNSFYGAYFYDGEREFNNLSILFGPSKVKLENDDTVIVISENNKPEHQNEGSESVYSPIFDAGTKLRRKLFDEGGSGGSDSTNEQHSFYYVTGPDGEPVKRVGRPLPPRTKNKNKCIPPMYSPNGSTCGSTNHNWWFPK